MAPTLIFGLIADLLLSRLRPSAEQAGARHLFSFLVPSAYTSMYFITLQLTQEVDWGINLWLGSIFMAGTVGLFLSLLLSLPAIAAQPSRG